MNSSSNYIDSDPKHLIDKITHHFWFFLFSIILALGVAFSVNYLTTPKYQISSSILIKENNKPDVNTNTAEYLNSSLLNADRNFQNELWVLKSAPILEQTIRKLDLQVSYYQKVGWLYREAYHELPFRVVLNQDHIQPMDLQLKIKFHDQKTYTITASGRKVAFVNMNSGDIQLIKKNWEFSLNGEMNRLIETPELAFIIQPNDEVPSKINTEQEYSVRFTDILSLSEQIRQHLEFKLVDKMATVVNIRYKSHSVKKGEDIVNEIMNAYLQQNLKIKSQNAYTALSYIERQLDEISDSLKDVEDALQSFRSQNQLLLYSDQAAIILNQNAALEEQLAELTTRRRYYDYVAEYLANNTNFSNMIVPASMGISDPLLNVLISELISAQSQRSVLIQNNQEQNPVIEQLNFKIENTKNTILENIAAIRQTLQVSIEEKNKRLTELASTIQKLPATQRKLGGMERNYKLNDDIYNYLLEKRAEAKITLASNLPDNLIIEPAKMVGRRPVNPKKNLNYLAAFLVGLAFPVTYLSFRESLDNKIHSQEDVEYVSNTLVVGKILHNRKNVMNVMLNNPHSPVSESFISLRTNLELIYGLLMNKVILVTSCQEGEGKTFTAINLATSYAQYGKRTLLIDFDLRNPTLFFEDIPQQTGLNKWYSDHLSINDIIQHSSQENLDFIRVGTIPDNPTELIVREKTNLLIEQLRADYDCIVLDTSPLAVVSDGYLLMKHANIILLITRLQFSNKRTFITVLKDMKRKKIENLNLVINDNKDLESQYGYGYGYGHHQKKKSIKLINNMIAK